jgi:Zn-dependent protease/CBS domain-containing protein
VSDDRPRRRRGALVTLARVRGVPILVSPTWILVALVLTVGYGPIIRDAVPGTSAGSSYATAAGFGVLFALCIVAHEVGHTLVSRALGYPVRRIVLFLLGGVSEIEGEPNRPRDELLIAAAGPLVSIAIGAAAWGGAHLAADPSLLRVVLVLLAGSNAVLAAFNLLPGLPLDGGRLLRAAVWGLGAAPSTGTRIAGWVGRVVAVGVAVTGLVVDRTSDGFAAGLISLVLAAYLWAGATQSIKLAGLLQRLPALDVRSLLRPGLTVAPGTSVAEALDRVWAGHARGIVLLDGSDRPSAIVDEARIGAVPPERRPWTPVSEVSRPLEPGLVLPEGLDAKELLDRMQSTPAHEYLVVDAGGAPAGIIAAVDFARRLQGRMA